MTSVKRKGERGTYRVVDRDCIARSCFQPGEYQHRGATMSGSRNTGDSTKMCLHNAYHGCPRPVPEPTKLLRAVRKAEGWKNA